MKLIIIWEFFFRKEITIISVRTRVNLSTVGKVKTKEIEDIFFFLAGDTESGSGRWWYHVSSPATENTNLVSN